MDLEARSVLSVLKAGPIAWYLLTPFRSSEFRLPRMRRNLAEPQEARSRSLRGRERTSFTAQCSTICEMMCSTLTIGLPTVPACRSLRNGKTISAGRLVVQYCCHVSARADVNLDTMAETGPFFSSRTKVFVFGYHRSLLRRCQM